MDDRSPRNRAFFSDSSKKGYLLSFCFRTLTAMLYPCYRQRLKLASLLLPLLCSCRAASDFSSDKETLGLWLGLADSGGCAELSNMGYYYKAQLWGYPARLCTTEQRSGHSYTEYLEIARKELQITVKSSEAYRTANCSDEVDSFYGFPSEPTLTSAIAAGFNVRDATVYPSLRWIPVGDIVYEGQGFLKDYWSMSSASIEASRGTTYSEYINIIAGLYINYIASAISIADPLCQTESMNLITQYHPGWLGYQIGDSNNSIRTIILSRCEYGTTPTNPAWLCTTLGPQF